MLRPALHHRRGRLIICFATIAGARLLDVTRPTARRARLRPHACRRRRPPRHAPINELRHFRLTAGFDGAGLFPAASSAFSSRVAVTLPYFMALHSGRRKWRRVGRGRPHHHGASARRRYRLSPRTRMTVTISRISRTASRRQIGLMRAAAGSEQNGARTPI